MSDETTIKFNVIHVARYLNKHIYSNTNSEKGIYLLQKMNITNFKVKGDVPDIIQYFLQNFHHK